VSQEDLIGLEVRLLLARYGKRRVLEALAAIHQVDLAAIETEIERYEARAKDKKRSRRKGIPELVEDARLDRAMRSIVEKIAYAYESKEFLPELRAVKRFLESQGISADKLRSRADALPKVIDVLAHQSKEGLEKLVADSKKAGRGDLGVIADQILGSGTRPR